MPTEEQFEEAKVRFFTAADDAQELLGQTRRANSRGALKGGKLTADVDGFVDEAGARFNAVAEGLRDLARECRKRAQECREAAAAAAAFQAASAEFTTASARHAADSEAFAADPTLRDPGVAPTAPPPPPTPPPYVEI